MFIILLLCVVLLGLGIKHQILGNNKTYWACIITVLVVDVVVITGLTERILGVL